MSDFCVYVMELSVYLLVFIIFTSIATLVWRWLGVITRIHQKVNYPYSPSRETSHREHTTWGSGKGCSRNAKRIGRRAPPSVGADLEAWLRSRGAPDGGRCAHTQWAVQQATRAVFVSPRVSLLSLSTHILNSLSLIHISEPRDQRGSRMPSSA